MTEPALALRVAAPERQTSRGVVGMLIIASLLAACGSSTGGGEKGGDGGASAGSGGSAAGKGGSEAGAGGSSGSHAGAGGSVAGAGGSSAGAAGANTGGDAGGDLACGNATCGPG